MRFILRLMAGKCKKDMVEWMLKTKAKVNLCKEYERRMGRVIFVMQEKGRRNYAKNRRCDRRFKSFR